MIAYKGTDNFKCINITYEVGKTYTFEGEIKLCKTGFHFCKNPDNVFSYYNYNKDFVLLEVEILGKTVNGTDKSVTDKFRVIREVPKSEYNSIFINYKFDGRNNLIHSKNSSNYESWQEYDERNNRIYFRDSNGLEIKWS